MNSLFVLKSHYKSFVFILFSVWYCSSFFIRDFLYFSGKIVKEGLKGGNRQTVLHIVYVYVWSTDRLFNNYFLYIIIGISSGFVLNYLKYNAFRLEHKSYLILISLYAKPNFNLSTYLYLINKYKKKIINFTVVRLFASKTGINGQHTKDFMYTFIVQLLTWSWHLCQHR